MNDNLLSVTAKLLANEDINVVRSSVDTASFDVINRTLTLPVWKDIPPIVDEMLVAHEVGHALYTNEEYVNSIKELDFAGAGSYMNILEDVRIEKLVKRKYPGLRKSFKAGYLYLNEIDFFSIKDKNLDSLHLLDRINLFFKANSLNIPFNNDEKVFVERAQKTETIKDVISLAKDLYEFIAEKKSETQISEPSHVEEDDGNGNEDGGQMLSNDSNFDTDEDSESESSQEAPSAGNAQDSNEDDAKEELPFTDKAFSSNMSQITETSKTYIFKKLGKTPVDLIIDYKSVLGLISTHRQNQEKSHSSWSVYEQNMTNLVNQFMKETDSNITYMVKEFEMRKSAQAFKRRQQSKSGMIDCKRLWSYQLNDDIFKRITTTKDGQNHGMMFLLDWSGSMESNLQDTLKQLVNLVSFCRRVKIPYQVLAFTNATYGNTMPPDFYNKFMHSFGDEWNNNEFSPVNLCNGNLCLYELFSSKMTANEHFAMVQCVLRKEMRYIIPTGGTPLAHALWYMYHHLDAFQKMNNVEKLVFISLTDGGSSNINIFSDYWSKDVINNVIEERTKVTKVMGSYPQDKTRTMYELIKLKYNCSVIGFFLTRKNKNSLASDLHAFYTHNNYELLAGNLVTKIMSEFGSAGFSTIPDTGHDQMYLIQNNAQKIENAELEIDSKASAKKIASNFNKFMTKNKTSRYLLNSFIKQIA